MIELYLFGGIAAVIAILWMRVGYLKKKSKALEIRADRAEVVAHHGEAVAATERERNEGKPQRIKKVVQDAEDNEFSDFYDDNP